MKKVAHPYDSEKSKLSVINKQPDEIQNTFIRTYLLRVPLILARAGGQTPSPSSSVPGTTDTVQRAVELL